MNTFNFNNNNKLYDADFINNKLKFYDIDKNYAAYLHKVDEKIPNISYSKHDKFMCGVVLNIHNMSYFAPVSHFNKKLRTNFVIYDLDKNDKTKLIPISSIRFSFMFPANYDVLKVRDFDKEDPAFRKLLEKELHYCNNNLSKIYSSALDTYKIGINKKNPLNRYCCNFKKLEYGCLEYYKSLNNEIAASLDEGTPLIKGKIVKLYEKDFPLIKKVSLNTIKLLDKLNKNYNHTLSIKELNSMYKYYGKLLEIDSNNSVALNNFKDFESIINDFKHVQFNQLHSQSKLNIPQHNMNNNLEL